MTYTELNVHKQMYINFTVKEIPIAALDFCIAFSEIYYEILLVFLLSHWKSRGSWQESSIPIPALVQLIGKKLTVGWLDWPVVCLAGGSRSLATHNFKS